MKTKMLVLLAVLLVAGVPAAAAGSIDAAKSIATGTVRFTRASVCEDPNHPGVFLQYYITDGCGRELFFYGDLTRAAVGRCIWAEGVYVQGGWCKVLELTRYSLCVPPQP